MNLAQAFSAFTNSHSDEIATAQYAVESRYDEAILLLRPGTFKLVKIVRKLEGNTETESVESQVIKYEDVTEFTHYPEKDTEVPLITTDNQVLIRSKKVTIVLACSAYDFNKMQLIFNAAKDNENDSIDA